MVKIRLQRHGKKGHAFFKIVVSDIRNKRDGRFIENIGVYNPNVNPAMVDLNIDRAVYWLEVGAQPSDTTRSILSHKGAMLKKHLNGGVKKGALTQEQADAKFEQWLKDKETKVENKVKGLADGKAKAKKAALDAEKEANAKKAAAIAAKNTPAPAEEVPAAEEAATEAPVEAAPEAPAAE